MTFLIVIKCFNVFHFQDFSFNHHPIHTPSGFLTIFSLPLTAGFLWSVASTSTHPNLAFTPTVQGSLLASMLSNLRATLELLIAMNLTSTLFLEYFHLCFYETLLSWLCPICPPIHSPCSSLGDVKFKLHSCSNLPMASPNPADLASLRIMPLFNAHCPPAAPGFLSFPNPQGVGTFCSLYLKNSSLPNSKCFTYVNPTLMFIFYFLKKVFPV